MGSFLRDRSLDVGCSNWSLLPRASDKSVEVQEIDLSRTEKIKTTAVRMHNIAYICHKGFLVFYNLPLTSLPANGMKLDGMKGSSAVLQIRLFRIALGV